MSQENVEIVGSMYEAFNDGDAERALAYLHPEAELHQPPELPDGGAYYGLAEFQRGLNLWLEEWESFRYEIEELTDVGDKVLVEIRLWGIAKGSGVETERRGVFHLWTIRDRKAQRCDVYFNRPDALEAAGLTK
jgi:ketosteroid isomerase-like protein